MTSKSTLLWLAILFQFGCGGSSPVAPEPSTLVIVTPATMVITPPGHAPAGPAFDLVFYREFAHDGLEQPAALQPLRRWTTAPKLYIRTIDEAGHPMDTSTLNTVQTAMHDVASIWGGGQFGLASVEQGTDTREGQAGWITVKWPNPDAGAFCGLSQVAVNGGWIELNYKRAAGCACGASQMSPATARHELGHAFGYYHTDNFTTDLMSILGATRACDQQPGAREAYHATIAYQSAVGSVDRLPASNRVSVAPLTIVD